MTEIKLGLWQAWMGDRPMPPGCTYEQFWAARDAVWAEDDREDALALIKQYEALKKRQTAPDIIAQFDDLTANETRRLLGE